MRSVFVVVTSASLVCALASPASAEPGRARQAATIRERPGDSYRVVGKLASGAKVELGRRKDGWVKLEGGRGGWVPESAVTASGGAASDAAPRTAKAAKVRPARPPRPKTKGGGAVAKPAARKGKRGSTGTSPAVSGEDAYAAAEAEWSGEATPAPAARTAAPHAAAQPPPAAEEEPPPAPRRKAPVVQAADEATEAAAPAADEEGAPSPPARRRVVAQADDETAAAAEEAPAEEDEPVVRKKKKRKASEDDQGDDGLDGKRHPGLLLHLWAMGGYNSWRERVTSTTDNMAVPLSNYDVPVGAFGVSVDGGVGYNAKGGFLAYLDGGYRYFGANPGIKINIEGQEPQSLGVISHAIDVGLRLGMLTDVVGAYARIGWTSTLTLVGFSEDAPLPSEKLKAVAVGGGLELPHLGPRVHARIRADYLLGAKRVQYANVDPFDSMLDGESQETVAWNASAALGVRLVKQFGLILGVNYRMVDTQFTGASERVKSVMNPMTKPITDTKRTSTVLLATAGIGFLWR